eukprot:5776468-Pyramimonas_sp.AAC.1
MPPPAKRARLGLGDMQGARPSCGFLLGRTAAGSDEPRADAAADAPDAAPEAAVRAEAADERLAASDSGAPAEP